MNKTSFYVIFIFNVFLSFSPFFFSNNELKNYQFYFFLIQIILLIPYILIKIRYVNSIFVPSFFILCYYLISFVFGSYYVPDGFGYITSYYYSDFLLIDNYSVILSYWMFVNTILFYLTCSSLNKRARIGLPVFDKVNSGGEIYIELLFLILLFILVSSFNFFGTFGIQFSIVLIYIIKISGIKKIKKIKLYVPLIILFVLFNHDNKREVIMMAMLIFSLETLFNRSVLKFNIKFLIISALAVLSFFMLILVSSILRGYGDFGKVNILNAILLVPQYIKSDGFINSILDNFEISHTYPAGILPIEYIINGKMSMLWGGSIIKPLFLIIPREVIDFKPESVLAIFTKVQDLSFYNRGGSLPVAFPAELYVNFGYILGLIMLYLLIYAINSIFLNVAKYDIKSYKFKLSISFTMLIFIFVRGGGLDLFVLTFLCSCIILFITSIKINKNQ